MINPLTTVPIRNLNRHNDSNYKPILTSDYKEDVSKVIDKLSINTLLQKNTHPAREHKEDIVLDQFLGPLDKIAENDVVLELLDDDDESDDLYWTVFKAPVDKNDDSNMPIRLVAKVDIDQGPQESCYVPVNDEGLSLKHCDTSDDDFILCEDSPDSDNFDDELILKVPLKPPVNIENTSHTPTKMLTLSELMKLTPVEWQNRSTSAINDHINSYCNLFSLPEKPALHYALLEKQDVNIGDSIAVIGDLHGHGLRLELTLKSLQNLGFLDANFHALPGKYIVFLGDYMDRGENNLKVLELLIAFKIENPHQVFLVKGNHEDISQNSIEFYTPKQIDAHYRNYMANIFNKATLARFYNHLPDTLYLGQRNEKTNQYQYAQYCHGLFHMYTDPLSLLADQQPHVISWIPYTQSFNSRIQEIDTSQINDRAKAKKIEALKKLKDLSDKVIPNLKNLHWFDLGPEIDNLGTGRETIPPLYAKAYLQLYSTLDVKIKEIFRAHQKGDIWRSGLSKNKLFITTIDPSQNEDQQLFLIMQTAPTLKEYKRSRIEVPLLEDHDKALAKIRTDESL
jgi:hypothetical protein